MDFDPERRYAAEYGQTPHHKTSIPKEIVNHERLLLETSWHEYRPTESSLIDPRSDPGLSFVQAPLPVSCLTSRCPVVSGVAHAEHRLDAEDRALQGRPDRLPGHRPLSRRAPFTARPRSSGP